MRERETGRGTRNSFARLRNAESVVASLKATRKSLNRGDKNKGVACRTQASQPGPGKGSVSAAGGLGCRWAPETGWLAFWLDTPMSVVSLPFRWVMLTRLAVQQSYQRLLLKGERCLTAQ